MQQYRCDVCQEADAKLVSKQEGFTGHLLICSQACSDEFWREKILTKDRALIAGSPTMAKKMIAVPYCERKNTHADALACGEDSFLISDNQQLIGVADGVGGYGGTSAYTSSCILNQMRHLILEHEKEKDGGPLRKDDLRVMLQKAHERCLEAKLPEGATTVTLALFDQQDSMLHVLNLGDSGAVVIRNGGVVFQTRPQTHRNNAPYQMASVPEEADTAKDADLYSFGPLKRGDYVVLGTDGVWDNITLPELSTTFTSTKVSGIRSRANADLGRVAENLVRLCRDSGIKPDDTTVVLARVYDT